MTTITASPTALRASSIWAGESMNKLIVSLTLLGTTALLAELTSWFQAP
jgi:hypothetical protein